VPALIILAFDIMHYHEIIMQCAGQADHVHSAHSHAFQPFTSVLTK
jgi:hypothetical protein